MSQSKRKLEQLIAQFPACGIIAAKHREGDGPYKDRPPTSIHIQRGDSNFLHFQADNIYVTMEDGLTRFGQDGLRATRYEYLVAASPEHEILGELRWPDTFPEKWEVFAKDIFTSVDPEKVSYLIWVIYYEWYEDLGGKETGKYFGRWVKPELTLGVYQKPKNRTWQEAIDTHLYPPQDMPVLSGIEQALREGCKLHAFTSGGGLRVIRIEQGDNLRGYGEAPHVEEALNHADEDFLAGGRDYHSVYGEKGKYPHYLTGSSHGTSNIDLWVRAGETFDVWQEGEKIVFQLDGWTSEQFPAPEWAMKWTELNPRVPVFWQSRGFVFELTFSDRYGRWNHSMGVFSTDPNREEVDATHWKITKTGRGTTFWDAMLGAFDAPEVEVIRKKRK